MTTHLPKYLFKVAQFRCDKADDSSRALTFLTHMDVYFEMFRGFALTEENANGLRNRTAAMRLNCFPNGSHAGVWFEQLFTTGTFTTYEVFVQKNYKHFVASQSGRIAIQTTWSN